MYKDQFVVAVKNGGKRILREVDGSVTLPFGCEYSILLKNLSSKRAKVNITIDGKDVLGKSSLILNPRQEMDLDGFLENNVIRNRFKFIEKTQQISEYRGDKADDGLIRVEVQFEKDKPEVVKKIVQEEHWHYDCGACFMRPSCHRPCNPCTHGPVWIYTSNSSIPSFNDTVIGSSANYHFQSNDLPTADLSTFTVSSSDPQPNTEKKARINNINNINCGGVYNIPPINFKPERSVEEEMNNIREMLSFNDQGITVKGSDTYVPFTDTTIGELEQNSTVIILKLKGTNSKEKKVEKPITVETNFICETCGKVSKSSSKFCDRCGTRLV